MSIVPLRVNRLGRLSPATIIAAANAVPPIPWNVNQFYEHIALSTSGVANLLTGQVDEILLYRIPRGNPYLLFRVRFESDIYPSLWMRSERLYEEEMLLDTTFFIDTPDSIHISRDFTKLCNRLDDELYAASDLGGLPLLNIIEIIHIVHNICRSRLPVRHSEMWFAATILGLVHCAFGRTWTEVPRRTWVNTLYNVFIRDVAKETNRLVNERVIALWPDINIKPLEVGSTWHNGVPPGIIQPLRPDTLDTPQSLEFGDDGPKNLTNSVSWSLNEKLDGGSYGDVYAGQWIRRENEFGIHWGVKVVVKILKPKDAKLIIRLKREALLWHKLNHPNIVTLYGCIYYNNSTIDKAVGALVSPKYSNGNLKNYLMTGHLTDNEKKCLCHDIASGLNYLHEQDPIVVHCDLKPSNVLIDENGSAALCDFGVSKALGIETNLTTTSVLEAGTLMYLAPEVVEGDVDFLELRTMERDVYAFGCVCTEIFCEKSPFAHVKWNVRVALIKKDPPFSHEDLSKVTFLPDLVARCLDRNPATRPTMRDIMNSSGRE